MQAQTSAKCPVCHVDLFVGTLYPGSKMSLTCGSCQANILVTDKGIALRKLAVPEIADLRKVKIRQVHEYRERYTAYAEAVRAEYYDNIQLVNKRCDVVLSEERQRLDALREREQRAALAKPGARPEVSSTSKKVSDAAVLLTEIIDMHAMMKRLTPEEVIDLKSRLTTADGCKAVALRFNLKVL